MIKPLLPQSNQLKCRQSSDFLCNVTVRENVFFSLTAIQFFLRFLQPSGPHAKSFVCQEKKKQYASPHVVPLLCGDFFFWGKKMILVDMNIDDAKYNAYNSVKLLETHKTPERGKQGDKTMIQWIQRFLWFLVALSGM